MENNPKISLLVAISKNRAIGKENQLLFSIPADLKRFKQLTLNHPVIMGRKTFESIGRPLPERTNIVITRDRGYKAEGVTVTYSLTEAIETARNTEQQEIFIIGGGQIYEAAMPVADRLYVTVIDTHVDNADTFFPEYPHFTKVLLKEENKHDGLKYTFYELEKEQV